MDISMLGNKLKEISSTIDVGKTLMNADKIVEFQTASESVEEKLLEIQQEGRKLRLGIVGEVKAGKSSFLNSLLFEGKDILPKAPTPMTAALTKISYSENPTAKIVFYNQTDWDTIELNARKYDEYVDEEYKKYLNTNQSENKLSRLSSSFGRDTQRGLKSVAIPKLSKKDFIKTIEGSIATEYKSCKELVLMCEDSMINVNQYLGTEKIIQGDSSDIQGYLKELNQYVGSEGRFTSIVKYTEIALNNKLLEGVEVIDTPGLNDPILSRTRVTKNFLIECDAVFVVGYSGQFLGDSEMEFIMSTLPGEGIKHVVLIGSKIDSAILQYPTKNNPNFKKAYINTVKNCKEQARQNVEKCMITPANEKLIAELKQSLEKPGVRCVSALAYEIAMKQKGNNDLDELQTTVFNNLRRRFPEQKFDIDTLLQLSDIPDIRNNVFENVKGKKQIIMQEKANDVVSSQVYKFMGLLDEIAMQARVMRDDLKNAEYDQLEKNLEDSKSSLDSVRIIVKNIFEQAAIDSRRTIQDIEVEIGLDSANYTDIEVTANTETKRHKTTSGIWLWKKTNVDYEHITTNSATVSEAERNINNYRLRCLRNINNNFKNLIRIEKMKNEIKRVVLTAFEQNDRNFDENRILIPLGTALDKITLPEFDIKMEKYQKILDSYLSGIASNGVVTNNNIPRLKQAQDRALRVLAEDIAEMLKTNAIKIEKELNKQGVVFVDNIVSYLEGNLKKLESLIKDKKSNLEKCDVFIESVINAKSELKFLGD